MLMKMWSAKCFGTLKRRFMSQRVCMIIALSSYTVLQLGLVWPSPGISKLSLAPREVDLVMSVHPWGALAGLAISAALLETCGRVPLLLLAGVLNFLSWLLIALCRADLGLLLGARFLAGTGGGLIRTAAPVYLVEVAKPEERGVSLAAILVFMIPGNLLELVAGPFMSLELLAWVSALIPLLFCLSALALVESPYLYLMRRDTESAAASLRALRATDDVAKELEEIQELVGKEGRLRYWSQFVLLTTKRRHLKSGALMGGVNALMGLSGPLAVMGLMQPIAKNAGIDSPPIASVLLTLVMTAVAPITLVLTKKIGVKKILLVSTLGTFFILVALVFYFYERDFYSMPSWLPLFLFILYFIFINLGFDLFPPVVAAEVLHPQVKAVGISLAAAINTFAQVAALHLLAIYPLTISFSFFAVNSMLFACLCFWFLPETKDKTLTAVQEEIGSIDASKL